MSGSNLKIILDTNVLLVALPSHSPYRLIFDTLLKGDYTLIISNDILAEYEEQIAERYDVRIVTDVLALLTTLPNIIQVAPYFQWKLIVQDPDDNKFVDAAIVGNADYLITNDKHFNILNSVEFPKVHLCKADEFKAMLSGL